MLSILIDSNMCLSTLKWKTDRSKTKFCFIASLSVQCKLLTGRMCKGPFITLPLAPISLVVPTAPCQVDTLPYIKCTQKCLKLNTRTWTSLLGQRELSFCIWLYVLHAFKFVNYVFLLLCLCTLIVILCTLIIMYVLFCIFCFLCSVLCIVCV